MRRGKCDRSIRKILKPTVDALKKTDDRLSKILSKTRDLTRKCAKAINLIHNRRYALAKARIEDVRRGLQRIKQYDCMFMEKYLSSVEQEYTEASVLLSLVTGKPLPLPDELEVSYPAYMNGLADTVGELRREMLDALISGDLDKAEWMFDLMSCLYEVLSEIKLSSAVLPGFKGKVDVARRQVENARSELFFAKLTGRRRTR